MTPLSQQQPVAPRRGRSAPAKVSSSKGSRGRCGAEPLLVPGDEAWLAAGPLAGPPLATPQAAAASPSGLPLLLANCWRASPRTREAPSDRAGDLLLPAAKRKKINCLLPPSARGCHRLGAAWSWERQTGRASPPCPTQGRGPLPASWPGPSWRAPLCLQGCGKAAKSSPHPSGQEPPNKATGELLAQRHFAHGQRSFLPGNC